MTGRLASIRRYPVKSCRGHDLDAATVQPWGLAGDRRWMLVDGDGTAVTARTHPRMVLITPQLQADGGLAVHAADVAPLAVEVPAAGPIVDVAVFASKLTAAPAPDAAHAWFSAVLDSPVRLVYLADPTCRPTDPDYGSDADVVTFADGYPLLLTTQESLASLNGRLDEPMPMTRFRPNLVVTGAPAWAEDGWRRVRVGAATFRVVKACGRCVLTTVDPETAEKGPEPLRTLATFRKWGSKVWFGVNLVPDTPGAVVHVGDPVEILESVPATEPPALTDWYGWHSDYADDASPLSRRLRIVRHHIEAWLDERPVGELRVVSACAGQGHDLIDVLAGRPDASRVRAVLLELDARNVRAARARIRAARTLGVTVRQADAGDLGEYVGAVPADLVLLVGVLGNISDADAERTIAALPQLCAAGATVIWSRSRRLPDLTTDIRTWFAAAGFAERAFVAPPEVLFSVGVHRIVAEPVPLDTSGRMFRFPGRDDDGAEARR